MERASGKSLWTTEQRAGQVWLDVLCLSDCWTDQRPGSARRGPSLRGSVVCGRLIVQERVPPPLSSFHQAISSGISRSPGGRIHPSFYRPSQGTTPRYRPPSSLSKCAKKHRELCRYLERLPANCPVFCIRVPVQTATAHCRGDPKARVYPQAGLCERCSAHHRRRGQRTSCDLPREEASRCLRR